jgi:heptosyltransferase-2
MAEDTIKIYEEAINRKNILVIKIGAIGDVILAVPSLRAIRSVFPKAFISVLVGTKSRKILKRCPYIDDMIIYDRDGKDKGIKGIFKIAGFIRDKAFDLSIDLQNNRFSHVVAWLGAVVNRYGYNNNKLGFLINKRLEHSKLKVSPVEEQFRVLRKAGINTIGCSNRLEMWPTKEDFLYIDNFLKNEWVRDNQVLLGLNIGSSWKTKRWPLKCFAKLADMLAVKDIRIVVTGSENEKDLARELMGMTNSKFINAVGKTSINELAALIKKCKVFITGDSAPMHIASSMGTEFIALFGPTDPKRHYEPQEKGIVIRKELNCSPCYKAECKNILCMENISVDEVYKKVMERIS